eukprot:GGOE01002215.1.p1 GENE.GGOE01002215.1~~GGOE01002215.1.p1  ORF type:complete len:281 (+),score=9.33 GGOE01002215.1:47-889(+)
MDVASTLSSRTRWPAPAPFSHDPTKRKSPGFSFGLALPVDNRTPSPGPTYSLPESVTRRGVSRGLSCSMGRRIESRQRSESPGPGAYTPESDGRRVIGRRPPAFTIGTRLDPPPNGLPGPGEYTPSKRSASPSFSFGSRSDAGGFLDLGSRGKTPGPGRYQPLDKGDSSMRSPSYSIGLPRREVKPSTWPGPGSHTPELCTVTKPHSPTWRMGPPPLETSIKRSQSPDTSMRSASGSRASSPQKGGGPPLPPDQTAGESQSAAALVSSVDAEGAMGATGA